MKRKHLHVLLAVILILPFTLKAQGTIDDAKYRQLIANASEEAKVLASVISKKYNADKNTENALFKMYYKYRLEVATTLANYTGTPELAGHLSEVITRNDSVSQVFLQAVRTNGVVKNKILRPDDISKFAAAVRLRTELRLKSSQVDSLMYHATKMPELRLASKTFNPKDYERVNLPKILTEIQFMDLLKHEYRDKALAFARDDWKELNERGLATGLDSAKVIREISSYNLNKWVNRDRYGNDIPSSVNLKGLETPMPEVMQKLRTSRKYNNPKPDKSSNAVYAW
jgi:hypothetical protein